MIKQDTMCNFKCNHEVLMEFDKIANKNQQSRSATLRLLIQAYLDNPRIINHKKAK